MLMTMTVPDGLQTRNDVTAQSSSDNADLNTSFFIPREVSPATATSSDLSTVTFSNDLRGIASTQQFVDQLNQDFAELTFSAESFVRAVNGSPDVSDRSKATTTEEAAVALAA